MNLLNYEAFENNHRLYASNSLVFQSESMRIGTWPFHTPFLRAPPHLFPSEVFFLASVSRPWRLLVVTQHWSRAVWSLSGETRPMKLPPLIFLLLLSLWRWPSWDDQLSSQLDHLGLNWDSRISDSHWRRDTMCFRNPGSLLWGIPRSAVTLGVLMALPP